MDVICAASAWKCLFSADGSQNHVAAEARRFEEEPLRVMNFAAEGAENLPTRAVLPGDSLTWGPATGLRGSECWERIKKLLWQ